MHYREISTCEIAELINVPFKGKDIVINGLNLCNRHTNYSSIVSYITSDQYIKNVKDNESVRALFLEEQLVEKVQQEVSRNIVFFTTSTPEEMFYKLHEMLYVNEFYAREILAPQVGKNCRIHSSVVLEDNVIIGDNVIVGPNSVIRSGSIIENDVRIGCCSVIGSEGFQGIRFANSDTYIIIHVGGTRLCSNVCVGDNTTVGNALFEGETIVGENTKIDNHVYIAHNLTIGKNNIITACCLLMGSSVLENNVWLAPNAVVMNKKVIHNDGFVGSMSLVTKDVPEGVTVVGIPAKEWVRK